MTVSFGTRLPFKDRIFKVLSENPGSMLMHTGALGWAASSAAQITGIAFNNKIDKNKKKFLIPQELGDATGNIALYYLVTLGMKNFAESLIEYGRIRFSVFEDELQKIAKKSKCSISDLFQNDKRMSDILSKNKELLTKFKKYKNGLSIVGTLIASVVSCNILTPYLRNFLASKYQEAAVKRAKIANSTLFAINQMKPRNVQQMSSFKNFMV